MGLAMPVEMEFCLLGPLLVRRDGAAVPIPRGKQRALLAALLLQAGRPVSADRLIDLLWDGGTPPSAAVSLQNYVRRLRRALGDPRRDRIATCPGGYLINVSPAELDITRLETGLAAARTAARQESWQQAAGHAAAAAALWRGEPLSGVDVPLLALQEAPRLSELFLQAREIRIEADLRLARHTDVVMELQELITAHPLREHLQALLMLALYRCGRRAEALAAYRHARALLVEELASEPGPELQALHQQVLTDDPALTAPAPEADDQAGTPVRPMTRQLPAAVGCFTGRDGELATLTGLLDGHASAGVPTMVISAIGGTAGVGKTALAIQWAHRVAAEFPDGQLYVNLRGYDPEQPLAPGEALAGFLTALGVPGPQIPPGADDRAAAYRSLLAGRRLLIVLDNARDAGQVRPLLPGEPGCLAVVTSRDMLPGLVARDGARRVVLDVLPPADAVALLRELVGPRVAAEPEMAARLAELCSRLPLALRIAAEMAAARPALMLAALVAELDGQGRLDVLEAGGDQATAVRTVFSWSYCNLRPAAARTFRLAALHPGADFDAHAVAALTGMSYPAATRALTELTQASLIHQTDTDRYGMHDLLRAYGAERATTQEPETDRREAMTRLLDHYLHAARGAAGILFPADVAAVADAPGGASGLVLSDENAAQAWLDAERANLTAVAVYASEHGWPGHAVGLSTALFRYLDAGGFLADALTIHGAAAQAAIRAHDRAAATGAVINIGTIYGQLGRYPEAEQHFQRALGLSRETADRLGEFRALTNLSQVYLRMSAYLDAADSCQQALELSRISGNRIGEARALGILGQIAIRQGRNQQAAADLGQAADASRAAGDLAFLAFSLTNLGEVEVRLGRYRQARRHLHEARTIARQIGHERFEADVTGILGFADLREGRYQQAAQRLQQALAAFRDAGVRSDEARLLCSLGELDLRLRRPAQAADRYREALTICQQIAETSGEAEAHNGLGEAALALGVPGEARAHHQAALAIASLGQQSRAHEGLGNVAAAAGDLAAAHQHWEQALAQYAEMDTPDAERIRARLTAMATN
jgi:DNA-binding SARP family transcriptional activator/Tfp pilus assembly protein PilF